MNENEIAALLRAELNRLMADSSAQEFLLSVLELLNDADQFRKMATQLLARRRPASVKDDYDDDYDAVAELGALLDLRIEKVAEQLAGVVQ